MKIIIGRTYFSNYCSSEERAQTLTKMGSKLKFYLLNLTALAGTNYKTSSRGFGVGIILVLPISEGDGKRKSNDGHESMSSVVNLHVKYLLFSLFFFFFKKKVREKQVTFCYNTVGSQTSQCLIWHRRVGSSDVTFYNLELNLLRISSDLRMWSLCFF